MMRDCGDSLKLTRLRLSPKLFDATVPMHDTGKMARHAHLNWAENMLLSHKHARSKTQLAVVSCIEPSPSLGEKASRQQRLDSGFIRKLTFDELYLEVARAASGLRKLGVGPGDKVAALTPNNAGVCSCSRSE